MSENIAQNPLEIKHCGLAIECGNLSILLQHVMAQQVLLMPVYREIKRDERFMQQWGVHVTMRPHHEAPVYYATVHAATLSEIAWRQFRLVYPYWQEQQAEEQARALQHAMIASVTAFLEKSPRVSKILSPARYRLPDEWVWSADTRQDEIACPHFGLWEVH